MLESGNGEMNTHPSYRIHGNRTEVTLTLAPNESVFIVFPTEEAADKESTSADKREPLNRTLETEEYTVTFLATGKTVVRKDFSIGVKKKTSRFVIIREQPFIRPLSAGRINSRKDNPCI